MIDNAFYAFKIIAVLLSIILVARSAKVKSKNANSVLHAGIAAFLIALFMTGVEMITPNDSPWGYLLISGGEDDWFKALMGGAMMVMLPVILIAVCGKNIEKILNTKSQ